MAVVSLVPLAVLFYISWKFVFTPLQETGQTSTVFGLVALLVFTAVAVVLGYVLVRRDTERTVAATHVGDARLARLHEATSALAAIEDSASVHTALVGHAADLVSAERAALWMRERDELLVIRTLGMSEERAKAHPLPVGQGLVGRAAELGHTLLEGELTDTDRSWDDRIVTKTHSSLIVPLLHRGELVALLDLRNKASGGPFTAADQQLVEGLARQAILFLDNAAFREAEAAFEDAVTHIVTELVDRYLTWPGHVENVQALCDALGKELALPPERQAELQLAASVHDIGLLDFPRVDIGPPGGPVDHASKGADRLAGMAFWAPVAPIVRAHHEQMDGRGPLGMRGFAIPMAARILAFAEYVDTVTNPGSPWGEKTLADVVVEVSRDDDKRFDRTVVEAFLKTQGHAVHGS